jgi:hypothetical protein
MSSIISQPKKVLGVINPNPTTDPILNVDIQTSSTLNPKYKAISKVARGAVADESDQPNVRRSERVKAQFSTHPKSKSKPKKQVDLKKVPRHVQLEAAKENGEFEVIGDMVEGGVDIPLIKTPRLSLDWRTLLPKHLPAPRSDQQLSRTRSRPHLPALPHPFKLRSLPNTLPMSRLSNRSSQSKLKDPSQSPREIITQKSVDKKRR